MNNEKTQNNIEEKVLEKISAEHISPKPKWRFLLRNLNFWLFGILNIFLGALTVAVSIFVFNNIRWELYKATHDNIFVFIVDFIPYLWIVLFFAFLIFTQYLIKKTKHGYKYHLSIIVGSVLISSVILGVVFSNLGFGKVTDRILSVNVPFYQGIEDHNAALWNNPDKGLLIGKISVFDDEVVLTTSDNKNWNLVTDSLDSDFMNNLDSDADIRVIGVVKNDQFYVCGILPDFDDVIKSHPIPKNFFERNHMTKRSIECEGVQPYKRLLEN